MPRLSSPSTCKSILKDRQWLPEAGRNLLKRQFEFHSYSWACLKSVFRPGIEGSGSISSLQNSHKSWNHSSCRKLGFLNHLWCRCWEGGREDTAVKTWGTRSQAQGGSEPELKCHQRSFQDKQLCPGKASTPKAIPWVAQGGQEELCSYTLGSHELRLPFCMECWPRVLLGTAELTFFFSFTQQVFIEHLLSAKH